MDNAQQPTFPVLTTPRLVLREMSFDDHEDIFTMFSNEAVTTYLDIATMERPIEAMFFIKIMKERFEKGRGIRWVITLRHSQQVLGTCGYNHWGYPVQNYRGEIGYDMAQDYWGQGFMGEALDSIIGYGFMVRNLNRIEALVLPENTRSIHLLQRLGFYREGTLRQYAWFKAKFWDVLSFSLLRQDWHD